MKWHKLKALKERIIRIEREVISEHSQITKCCDNCRTSACSKYMEHIIRIKKLLADIHKLKRSLTQCQK